MITLEEVKEKGVTNEAIISVLSSVCQAVIIYNDVDGKQCEHHVPSGNHDDVIIYTGLKYIIMRNDDGTTVVYNYRSEIQEALIALNKRFNLSFIYYPF